MDHAEATRRFAVEQYLLGELSDPEQEEFEEHFFVCPDCAALLETGSTFIANAQAVFRESEARRASPVRERKTWFLFPGWSLAPAAALAGCAILAVITGYQNLVEIPALRQPGLAMAPAVSVRAARALQDLSFSKRSGILSLTVAHEWEEAYAGYQAEIERAADHRIISTAEITGTPEDIMVTSGLERFATGSYFLNLYGLRTGPAARTAIARVPFTLTQ